MANLARVDIMVGEFWADSTWTENWQPGDLSKLDKLDRRQTAQNVNVKQVASTSHLYGKPVVDMESFTSFRLLGCLAPADLLLPANVAFCEGVNHMCFHASDTTDSKEGSPGNTYVGTLFNDKNTWWPQVGAFTRLHPTLFSHAATRILRGRCRSITLATRPSIVPSKHVRPSLGFGYDYDECNSEALLTCLTGAGRQIGQPFRYELSRAGIASTALPDPAGGP